eukprot:TRINITY_DN12399_c0_g2_i1.p1 TRINITY_DN12399_c0_g2~~TRINITY_DN12399_c0_g2_i1.p1  ORF type:complete len:1158 (+),score=286.72 TRINITY_DN12399_c0_g2_i1:76-3549(+)
MDCTEDSSFFLGDEEPRAGGDGWPKHAESVQQGPQGPERIEEAMSYYRALADELAGLARESSEIHWTVDARSKEHRQRHKMAFGMIPERFPAERPAGPRRTASSRAAPRPASSQAVPRVSPTSPPTTAAAAAAAAAAAGMRPPAVGPVRPPPTYVEVSTRKPVHLAELQSRPVVQGRRGSQPRSQQQGGGGGLMQRGAARQHDQLRLGARPRQAASSRMAGAKTPEKAASETGPLQPSPHRVPQRDTSVAVDEDRGFSRLHATPPRGSAGRFHGRLRSRLVAEVELPSAPPTAQAAYERLSSPGASPARSSASSGLGRRLRGQSLESRSPSVRTSVHHSQDIRGSSQRAACLLMQTEDIPEAAASATTAVLRPRLEAVADLQLLLPASPRCEGPPVDEAPHLQQAAGATATSVPAAPVAETQQGTPASAPSPQASSMMRPIIRGLLADVCAEMMQPRPGRPAAPQEASPPHATGAAVARQPSPPREEDAAAPAPEAAQPAAEVLLPRPVGVDAEAQTAAAAAAAYVEGPAAAAVGAAAAPAAMGGAQAAAAAAAVSAKEQAAELARLHVQADQHAQALARTHESAQSTADSQREDLWRLTRSLQEQVESLDRKLADAAEQRVTATVSQACAELRTQVLDVLQQQLRQEAEAVERQLSMAAQRSMDSVKAAAHEASALLLTKHAAVHAAAPPPADEEEASAAASSVPAAKPPVAAVSKPVAAVVAKPMVAVAKPAAVVAAAVPPPPAAAAAAAAETPAGPTSSGPSGRVSPREPDASSAALVTAVLDGMRQMSQHLETQTAAVFQTQVEERRAMAEERREYMTRLEELQRRPVEVSPAALEMAFLGAASCALPAIAAEVQPTAAPAPAPAAEPAALQEVVQVVTPRPPPLPYMTPRETASVAIDVASFAASSSAAPPEVAHAGVQAAARLSDGGHQEQVRRFAGYLLHGVQSRRTDDLPRVLPQSMQLWQLYSSAAAAAAIPARDSSPWDETPSFSETDASLVVAQQGGSSWSSPPPAPRRSRSGMSPGEVSAGLLPSTGELVGISGEPSSNGEVWDGRHAAEESGGDSIGQVPAGHDLPDVSVGQITEADISSGQVGVSSLGALEDTSHALEEEDVEPGEAPPHSGAAAAEIGSSEGEALGSSEGEAPLDSSGLLGD